MTATTGRRNVKGYQRKDGTRVNGYSQRYQKGDAKAVAGGLAVAATAAVVASLHLLAGILELVAAVALAVAMVFLTRAAVRRRRLRKGARARRGRYMVVQAWRRHRANRKPVRRKVASTHVRKSKGPRGKTGAGTYKRNSAGEWVKVTSTDHAHTRG